MPALGILSSLRTHSTWNSFTDFEIPNRARKMDTIVNKINLYKNTGVRYQRKMGSQDKGRILTVLIGICTHSSPNTLSCLVLWEVSRGLASWLPLQSETLELGQILRPESLPWAELQGLANHTKQVWSQQPASTWFILVRCGQGQWGNPISL